MALPDPLPSRLTDPEAAERLFAALAEEAVEVLAFVFLDAEQRVLGMRQFRSHAAGMADVPIRAVVGDAIAHDAAGVVMAHNHPRGDPTPSLADREVTRRIVRALEPLGMRLLDHLVVSRGGSVSFRALGLL